MKPTVLAILRQASIEAGVSCETLLARNNDPCVSRVRFAVMKTARDFGYSKRQIARRLMRDQSTIWYGAKRAAQIASTDAGFRSLLRRIRLDADRCACPECVDLDAMPLQGIEHTFQIRLPL